MSYLVSCLFNWEKLSKWTPVQECTVCAYLQVCVYECLSVCFSTRVISTNHPPLCQEVAGLPLRLTSFPVRVIAIALFSTLFSSCLFSVHTHIDSYLKELLTYKWKFSHHWLSSWLSSVEHKRNISKRCKKYHKSLIKMVHTTCTIYSKSSEAIQWLSPL